MRQEYASVQMRLLEPNVKQVINIFRQHMTKVLTTISSIVDKCDSNPCENGGACKNGVCECADGFTGEKCDIGKQTIMNRDQFS